MHIILSTLNARYIHSSLGLRYLHANMQALADDTEICEFIINTRPIDIAEKLLAKNPKIIGFGIYIWNIAETTDVISIIKLLEPNITIVIGGPEVSFEQSSQKIVSLSDYVISGAADHAFRDLCEKVIKQELPKSKFISPLPFDLSSITFPYFLYNNEDIQNRVLYVEASRGCPFKCEFCLSSLDKTAWNFDIDLFLHEIQKLYDRGARRFKFVDRTFNLKISHSKRILTFFLDKKDNTIFLHFELIPDHLPDPLKEIIQQFPQGTLQFEIGIQSFDDNVQQLISRKQNNAKSKENIRWLVNKTHAHLHTDLILGLPGDNLSSIAKSFDELMELKPHEIQVGILKRLRGTPLTRHTENYTMKYNTSPPYNILSNKDLNFDTMQRLNRFARYWDMIANSGRFSHTLPMILDYKPFIRFLKLSDWLYKNTDQTHKINLNRLFSLLHRSLIELFNIEKSLAEKCLLNDYQISGLKGRAKFLIEASNVEIKSTKNEPNHQTPSRQSRHLQS